MPQHFEKAVVVGVSGAGKSTLAQALATKLKLAFIDTDALLWEPNWQRAIDYDDKLTKACDGPTWVVAGADKVALSRATTVIWLDYSLWTTFWQLFWRTMKRCWTQELLWGTNRESIWVQLQLWSPNSVFHWLFKNYWARKRAYPALLAQYPHLTVHHFKSPNETSAWLRSISPTMSFLRRLLPLWNRYAYTRPAQHSPPHRSRRRRARQLRQLRECLYIVLYVVQLLYYLWSIPFRLGFIFDPYYDDFTHTIDAVVWPYIMLDIAADSFGAVNFYYFLHARGFLSVIGRGATESAHNGKAYGHNQASPRHVARHGEDNVASNMAGGAPLVLPYKHGHPPHATAEGNAPEDRDATVSFRHLNFITSISARTLTHIPSLQLLLEAVALLPIEVVVYYMWGFNAVHVARVVKLLRLTNLNRAVSAFKTYLATHNLLVHLHNIAKGFLVSMALFNLVLFHWIGCGYMLMAHLECGRHLDLCTSSSAESTTSSSSAHHRALSSSEAAVITGKTCWAIEKQLADLDLFPQYIRTMLIVTYGDATSYSFAERCVSIGIQLARALMSCAIIGSFELYSKSRNLPVHLRNKVLGYFDYFWRVQLGILENNIVAMLPIHFQTQCIDVLKAQVIAKVHFLSDERPNVIQNLATLLTSQVYMPLDWITKNIRIREMYFISRGRVVLVDNFDNIQFKLNQGDTFGDISLFVENGFAYKALAETFCELYQLNRDVFETVLSAFYTDQDALEAKRMAMTAAIEQREHQLLKTQKLLGQMISLQTLLTNHDRSTSKWTLPNSKFRTIWSALFLASLVYVAVEVPYKLIFYNSQDVTDFFLNKFNYAMAMGIEIFHVAHIVLMMRHFAFEDKSSIVNTAPVVDSDLIFARYKESRDFWWDLAAVVPIALVGDLIPQATGSFVQVLRTGRVLRLLRMRYFQSVLSEVLEAYHVSTSMKTVVYLSLGVLLVTHIAGCFWFFVADLQVPRAIVYGTEWVRNDFTIEKCMHDGAHYANCTWFLYDAVHYPHNAEYPRSLFWSVMTLTSVGYGVIFPFTTAECVYAFAWFYVSGLINFGVIGAISSAIAQLMANENRTQDTLLLINRFMKFKGVSSTVQTDIRRYYKNQWVREKGVSEELFLSVLPNNVQHEILTFLHANTLRHVSLFHDTGDECKQVIASIIRHESYQAGDIVLRAGDLGCDLYILRSGNVELRTLDNTPMRILHPEDCYGEYNFVLEVPYKSTVQAMASTELSVLRRNEFEQIIKFFPDEWDDIYHRALAAQGQEESLWARMKANMRRDKLINLTRHSVTLYVTPPRETGVIPPGHPFRLAWTVLLAVAILYNLFVVVFRLAFLQYPSDATMSVLWTSNLLFDSVYFVDMYLNYWHFTVDLDGFVHLDMAESRAYYRQNHFRRNVLASLPLYYVGNTYAMALCRVPRLLRTAELPAMVTRFQLWIQENVVSAKLTAFLRLVKLLLVLIVVAHITGAIYYFLGDPTTHEHDDVNVSHEWFVIDLIIRHYNGNALVAYIRSFYWALTTKANEFDERIENFDEYARSQNLPRFLLERGHQYFQYQFDCTRGMEADVIFSELPHSLRMKLFYDLYGHRLRGLTLFHAMDAATLASIAERLIPVLYLPHDNIILEGGTGAALYIMHQGRAEKYVRKHNLVVAAVHEGTMFGELAFFLPHMTHATSVRAVTCCELLRLEKADWVSLWPETRRTAMEDAMTSDLDGKHAYLTMATANIVKNLVASKGPNPHVKVRKQLLSRLRRMPTYGRTSAIVFKKLAARASVITPVRDKFKPQKDKYSKANTATTRVHPVRTNEHDNDWGEKTNPTLIKPMKKPKPHRIIKSSFKPNNANNSGKSAKRMRARLNSVKMIYASDSATSNRSIQSVTERTSDNAALTLARDLGFDDDDDDDGSDDEVLDDSNEHFQQLNLLRRAYIGVQERVGPELLEMASIWGDLHLPPEWSRPHSHFRKTWDLFMLAAVMYYSVAVPMRASFIIPELMGADGTESNFPLWLGVEFVVDVVSLIDVYFRFNYFCQVIGGEVSSELRLIRHHYRTKGGLWFDVVAMLPLELVGIMIQGYTYSVSTWRFNKLLRLYHLGSLNAKARDAVTLHFKSVAWLPRLWSFCNICGIFVLVGHWVSCLWFYISVVGGDASLVFYAHSSESFVTPHGYTPVDTLQSAYVKSFYYAMTSLTSITFGDIYSTSLAQTIATIFIIFTSLTAYGVLTGGFTEIFEVELKKRVKFEEQTGTVSMFLMHRQFPRQLTIQILEYFRNMWEHSEGVVESQALAPLSSALREDIAVYVKRDLITKVHLFSDCDQDFTRAIVSVLQAEFFVAKDVIIREGDYDRSMYFIHTGFVLVTNAAKSYEVIKRKGDFFGEMSLLHNTPRSGSCSALSNCDMFILDYDSYEYVLERFPRYRSRNLRNWCAVHLSTTEPKGDNLPATSHNHQGGDYPFEENSHPSDDGQEDPPPPGNAMQLQSLSDIEHNADGRNNSTLDEAAAFDEEPLRIKSQILTRESVLHIVHPRTHHAASGHREGMIGSSSHIPPPLVRQSTPSKLRKLPSSHALDARRPLSASKSLKDLNDPLPSLMPNGGDLDSSIDARLITNSGGTFTRRATYSQLTMDAVAMRRMSAMWMEAQASSPRVTHRAASLPFHGLTMPRDSTTHEVATVAAKQMAVNILRHRAVHTAAATSSSSTLDGMTRRMSVDKMTRSTPR
ncbi:hypothetical protein DYB34_001223 [Aphanomyces astaci]|uniref:Cyclic nucleotide-binding domain-containing protein n=1 Tax=Aphanomyces astaci TaxID=112090 RepID=A0A3R6W664_APHAT|nr:hypothetical protein DYB34_001223 [Aphanomyces astaci]